MRHRKHTFKIGRRPAHVRSLLANQVCSLLTEGRIQTTLVKAKESRRLAERMITLGKKGTLHHRRRAIAILQNTDVVAALFADIAPKYMDRPGGYTRIIKLGERRGDAAEMCFLELVQEPMVKGGQSKAPAAKATEADEDAAVEAEPVSADEEEAK